MPNWCYNNATFTHKDPAMIKKLIDGAKDGNLFNTFVPMPEELRNTSSPSEPNETLIEKYGASDWYSWAVANWGTKWDTSFEDISDSSENEVSTHFDTAWSPPIAFYNAMTELGFDIDATFTEEAMQYAGIYQYGEEESMDLNFDKDSQKWIDEIENDDLKELVQYEFDSWLELQE